jgi:hypothetical protein
MAKVRNRKHLRPWEMKEMVDRGTAVYIGRPSKWGNPFVIGRDGTRDQVVEKFGKWIVQQDSLMASIPELVGKDLICFCAPLRCHGDVLKALADNYEDSQKIPF